MKYGARNAIEGKVTAVKKGTVMCQVAVDVKVPIKLTSVMTVDSLNEMGLKEGSTVRAIIKGIHVLLVSE